MSLNKVRRLVSGGKARFVDLETAVDLDLVYGLSFCLPMKNMTSVIDHIFSMGYPATGAASLYRNKRQDVLRFLNARHGEKWWIWNLCPLYENAYTPESMHNRVSRYPFPDHHPPPLPLLPLAVKEMTAWLAGDEERIAIIHCKAGKGRSGTLLCSYLLSLPELPPAPQRDHLYPPLDTETISSSAKNSPKPLEFETTSSGKVPAAAAVDNEMGDGPHTPARSERIQVDMTSSAQSSALSPINPTGHSYTPMDIGDEGSPGEVGQEDRADGKVDSVLKFHSSRRMKASSTGRGVSIPSPPPSYISASERVRLISVTYILKPPSTWQKPFVPLIVGGGSTGQGRAFASVARYDDYYVEELRRRGGEGEGIQGEISWGGVGGEGQHDKEKMFRKCGKLVPADLDDEALATLPSDHKDYVVHHLVPNTPSLILDRSRELRLRFQLGSMPLGWAWLIPAFHLPEPEPAPHPRTHTLHFPRSQIDFPLGPGSSVIEVIVRIREVPHDDQTQPAKLMNDEEEKREGVYESRAGSILEESE